MKLFVLSHAEARRRAAAECMSAPEGWTVTVRPPKRSSDANAKLHAMLGNIAERVKWAGEFQDIETWKRLLTAAWLRARGEPIRFLPALDGQGVDIVFRRTSSLSRAECAELIDYIDAWAAQAGVTFNEPAAQAA